jgi:enoyl-CoA hydratase/carnithine racemase
MSDLQYCKTERDGRIFTLTINRPEVMNALHPMASEEMSAALDEFVADPELWVAIITGAGDRAFSAGNDLKFQASGGGGGRVTMPKSGFGGITSRFDNPKPVIAAVNGVAMGGGFEIALACDIILASEKALFALPEPRVGLAALAGGIHRLPRQIGQKQAMGMLLTGRRVGAEEGKQLGFVNEVVPHDELLKTARAWAEQILECAPLSVRASKEAAMMGLEMPLQEAMSGRFEGLTTMVKSEDFIEGPRAFAEKRPPQWKGK